MADQNASNDCLSLTSLVAGLVHEVRNPLSTINLNLQLLREDWADAETPREKRALRKIDLIRAETQRLEGVLNDILRFVRIGSLDLQPVDVNALLDQIVDFKANELRLKNIEVIRFYDYNLPRCQADPALLKQALLNILLNAQQAMDDNGGQIMIRTSRDGEYVRIEITDTGCGMAPDVLKKIFVPWFSTKPNGTGLGLPTTRRIIEAHGGTIAIQSEQGRGTSVVTRLLPSPPPSCAGASTADG